MPAATVTTIQTKWTDRVAQFNVTGDHERAVWLLLFNNTCDVCDDHDDVNAVGDAIADLKMETCALARVKKKVNN